MKKAAWALTCLAIATVGPVLWPAAAQQGNQSANSVNSAGPDLTVLHVQVLLDRIGFGPGVIDGKGGQSLKLALTGYQKAAGLQQTGEIDQPTLRSLHRFRAIRPLRALRLSQADVAGPFVGKLPEDPAAQAALPTLGYADALERLAEKFHTTPQTLAALNPGGRIAPGAVLRFPNVLPSSRDYDPKLPEAWRRTLSDLNVSAVQPQADLVVVDKSDGVLRAYAGDRLLAQFPATMGSSHDPLPLGSWKIQGLSYNPTYAYNPSLLRNAKSDEKHQLPAGPNSPVGVIWMDMNKPHYGIHGTPEPQTIGRAESNGCVRLTNWDAARLSLMVKAGTKARFQA